MPPAPPVSDLVVRPANEATFEDIQAVFGERGAAHVCQCQRNKLARGEAFSKQPLDERMGRLRLQSACGDPDATATTGVVGYADGEPVGWCAVEPRPAYEGMVRNSNRAAWVGRDEDRTDEGIWAITCVFVRAGHRGHRYSRPLVQGAVDHARRSGARALEAYPIAPKPGEKVIWEEVHPGTPSMFAAAGLVEVHVPSKRRRVMRIEFRPEDRTVSAPVR